MPFDEVAKRVLIVIPAYNEVCILRDSIRRLHDYCSSHLKHIEWTLVIADNGSTDESGYIGRALAHELRSVAYDKRPMPGRGGSLAQVWSLRDADVYLYMDVDLATDICHLPELIQAIILDGYDIAVGSRLMKESSTSRSLLRGLCSHLYSVVPRLFFRHFPSTIANAASRLFPAALKKIFSRS